MAFDFDDDIKSRILKQRIDKAREYVKNNVWKQFLKQKIYELGIIPLGVLAIWKIPSIIGWSLVKLFNIDIINNTWFCKNSGYDNAGKIVCDGVNYNNLNIWLFGVIILLVLILFLGINWIIAERKVKNAAADKFKVSYYDVDGYGMSI